MLHAPLLLIFLFYYCSLPLSLQGIELLAVTLGLNCAAGRNQCYVGVVDVTSTPFTV